MTPRGSPGGETRHQEEEAYEQEWSFLVHFSVHGKAKESLCLRGGVEGRGWFRAGMGPSPSGGRVLAGSREARKGAGLVNPTRTLQGGSLVSKKD